MAAAAPTAEYPEPQPAEGCGSVVSRPPHIAIDADVYQVIKAAAATEQRLIKTVVRRAIEAQYGTVAK